MSAPAAPKYTVGQTVQYVDRQGRTQLGKVHSIEARWTFGPKPYPHDNCGGGCCRAGYGHWAHTLRVRPHVYARWEQKEQDFNDRRPGRTVQTILRKEHRNGPATPFSLRQLRERIQSGRQIDMFDIGGCGCFVGDAT